MRSLNAYRTETWCAESLENPDGRLGPIIPAIDLTFSATRAREAGWDFHELAIGHDVMVIAPEMLVERLLALP